MLGRWMSRGCESGWMSLLRDSLYFLARFDRLIDQFVGHLQNEA